MTRQERLIRLASLLAALLSFSACVHNASVHCDLREGVWECSGGASGTDQPPGM